MIKCRNSTLIISIDDKDLKDILTVLSDLSEWEKLGTHLTLKDATIQKIKRDDHTNSTDARKRDMLVHWLQMKGTTQPKTPPTWRQLIQALHSMEEHVIEEKVINYLR